MRTSEIKKTVLRDSATAGYLLFERPSATLVATEVSDVLDVLHEVEDAVVSRGLYAAGYVGYEAAAGFDSAYVSCDRSKRRLPLVCMGLFPPPTRLSSIDGASSSPLPLWRLSSSREAYLANARYLLEQIAAGNCYQVNHAIRLTGDGRVDSSSLFRRMAAGARYAAWVECSDHAVVSGSPELFFRLNGSDVLCQPMKGTCGRGRTLAEDRAAAAWLHRSEKNRAENVMITDMIRNDLGRVATPGSVVVRSLFDIVKLPTLWQMTSTVSAKSRAPVSEIFSALFPCASVTGAPKAASVQLIAATEDAPREVYTGAIGYVGPGRQAEFNVAIRTAWIDKETGKSVYGIGSGIVADSLPADEFDECLLKARALTNERAAAGFELLETLRWTSGSGYFLLKHHLERLRRSAEYFEFPFDRAAVDERLAKLAESLGDGDYRVRLLLASDGQMQVTWSPIDEKRQVEEQPLRLATRPVDRDDPFLYHKTTRRDVYQEAVRQAGGAYDVLLWNGDGFVTESTVANVLIRTGGDLVTPPISCGLLAGTYRQWLLEEGKIEERPVHVDELAGVDALYLTNSVRGCYRASLIRGDRPPARDLGPV